MSKAKEKKPNIFKRFFSRIARWFREMRSELKKVVWPSGHQVLNNCLVVIATVIVCGIFIWAFDWIAGIIVKALISVF